MLESAWISQIFNSHAARNGGIVRRKSSDVRHYSSPSELERAVKARGYHLILAGDQYLIICNSSGEFQLLC